ncbi:MAG: PaaI family thioesterase, partial [Alphaproteobacteria bacterium]
MHGDAPEGFVPQGRSSPFLAPFEPIWERPFDDGLLRGVIVAVRLGPPHLNGKGLAHGALLTALADIAMGRSLAAAADPPQRYVTVSLSIDYHAPARAGDWLEARVNHLRAGRRLGFAS